MRKTLICALLLTFSFVSKAQKIENYNGNILVDIEDKKIQAEFTITFSTLSDAGELKLFLTQSANISNISSNDKPVVYEITEEAFIGHDRAIIINTKDVNNKKLTIQYAYDLDRIQNKDFLFNENWLELNLYTSWFPLNTEYGLFAYDINVQLPKDYQLIGSGKTSNVGELWRIKQNNPFLDIPIIISSNFKHFNVGKGRIKTYYLLLDKKTKKTIKTSAKNHYNQLNTMLGNSSSGNLVLAINKFNRSISYSRKGFISLSIENSFKVTDEKTLAHEIAHLWWNKANVNTWEDWLNESFAEYSSIILQRNLHGEKSFNENIKKLKKTITDLPSLYKLKEEKSKNQKTTTYKGAYLLYELENKVGRKDFEQLLKKVHKDGINKTSEFLDLVKSEFGVETEQYITAKLNE